MVGTVSGADSACGPLRPREAAMQPISLPVSWSRESDSLTGCIAASRDRKDPQTLTPPVAVPVGWRVRVAQVFCSFVWGGYDLFKKLVRCFFSCKLDLVV